MRVTDETGWTLHRPKRRFRLRRGRALPGPLRSVSPRRGTGSWLASFVVFGAAVVAIAVAVSGLASQDTQVAEHAASEAAPRRPSAAGTSPKAAVTVIRRAAEPAQVVHREAEPPSAAVAATQPSERPKVADASAGGDASPFQLDRLPVLESDSTGLEADPARPAVRTGQRRAPAQGAR